MIGYVTLGTNDLAKAAVFYDAIARELGTKRFMENEQFIAWAGVGGSGGIGLTKPFNGQPATVATASWSRFMSKTRLRSNASMTWRSAWVAPTKARPAPAVMVFTPPISAIPTATSSTPLL